MWDGVRSGNGLVVPQEMAHQIKYPKSFLPWTKIGWDEPRTMSKVYLKSEEWQGMRRTSSAEQTWAEQREERVKIKIQVLSVQRTPVGSMSHAGRLRLAPHLLYVIHISWESTGSSKFLGPVIYSALSWNFIILLISSYSSGYFPASCAMP